MKGSIQFLQSSVFGLVWVPVTSRNVNYLIIQVLPWYQFNQHAVATPPTLPLKASEYDRACFAKVWCIQGVSYEENKEKYFSMVLIQ